MPTVSTKIKVSRDGQYIMAVGELTKCLSVAEAQSARKPSLQNDLVFQVELVRVHF